MFNLFFHVHINGVGENNDIVRLRISYEIFSIVKLMTILLDNVLVSPIYPF